MSATADASAMDTALALPPLRAALHACLRSAFSSGGQHSSPAQADAALAETDAAAAAAAARGANSVAAWCMAAIQKATQAAPAVRRPAAAAVQGVNGTVPAVSTSGAPEAKLVLHFLSNMLQALRAQSQLLDDKRDSNAMDSSEADAPAAPQQPAARSLLPFLYAHLFKYCLHLREYDAYHALLLHMPRSFDGTGSGDGQDQLKLECLKRFLIELLRERRTHDLIQRFDWNFEWDPKHTRQADGTHDATNDATGTAGERTVREEVEAMLWWNAQTSDLDDDAGAGATMAHSSAPFAEATAMGTATVSAATRVTGAGHYDLLYTFLLSGQRYVRAAQAMQHFFLRLESESCSHATGGVTGPNTADYVTATVRRLSLGRGRTGGSSGASELTLQVVAQLHQRKLHALLLIRDALRLAARRSSDGEPDEEECFMLESEVSWTSDGNAQAEPQQNGTQSHSPLYKKSRAAIGGDSSITSALVAGRTELLSLRAVSKRVELLLSQMDLLRVLQGQVVAHSAAELPPLDVLLDTPSHTQAGALRNLLTEMMRVGLVDRAFHLVQQLYEAPAHQQQQQGATSGDEEKKQDGAGIRSLDCNALREQYEDAATFVVQQFAQRICRMHAALTTPTAPVDDAAAADDALFPLCLEDSLSLLRAEGSVSGRVVDAPVAVRVRDAERVLQLYLTRLDGAHSTRGHYLLAVAAVYLSAGADVPLWMRDAFTACMEASAAEREQEQRNQGTVFQLRTASQLRTGHAATLSAYPLLNFLRLLLEFGRFELLFVLSCRYLEWVAAQSGRGVLLERGVLADVMDGFLFVQQQADELPASHAGADEIRRQTSEWVTALRRKIQAVLGAAGAADSSLALAVVPSSSAPKKSTVGFGTVGFGSSFGASAGSAFGTAPATQFSLLPTGGAPAPAARATAAAPQASPFSAAPAVSPFAFDQSAAATPAKHPFGGLPSFAASTEAPASAATGFGSGFSFGGFGAAPATPAAAPTFSFGAPASAAKSGQATSTAALIARASGV